MGSMITAVIIYLIIVFITSPCQPGWCWCCQGAVKFATPVHDSLLFLPEDGEYVRSVMLDEFAELGIQPRLEIKDLNE